MYEIKNDRLHIDGRPVRFEATAHVGGRIEPVAIVVHDTAGGPPGDSVGWLRKNPKKVSAHAIIMIDGTLVQLADFDLKTNHAGESIWRGIKNCNGRMIGLEMQNPGHLRGKPDKAVSEFGRVYGAAEGVVACKSTQWHGEFLWMPYTEAQLHTLEQTIGALGRGYSTITEVIGHHHISPGRKDDPTPLLDWNRMRAALGVRLPQQPPAVDVKEAQLALIDLGYHIVGSADGYMGQRTRAAIFAFQEANRLKATGQLDEITFDLLRHSEQMGAKEMATGARDEATADTISSPSITAAKVGEVVAGVTVAVQTGNMVSQAVSAVTEANKVVTAVELGRDVAARGGDLLAWLATPQGITTLTALVTSAALWAVIRYVRNRRVNATKTGKQN